MSRLTEAGEKKSETLLNALVINGLPEKYEHFVVQESFNPASTFTKLRTRLQNLEESRKQRKQPEVESHQQCISEGKIAEIRKYHLNPKFVTHLEIQDILQNNVTKE